MPPTIGQAATPKSRSATRAHSNAHAQAFAKDRPCRRANGESLLKIVGKDQTGSLRQGILQPAEMAQAIAALQQAVALEDQAHAAQIETALENGQTAPKPSTIGLRQRSLPFIQMLQRCLAENEEVVWGV